LVVCRDGAKITTVESRGGVICDRGLRLAGNFYFDAS
jgi:hypothetical protein